MTQKTFTVVTTTINTPTLLRAYAEDAIRFRRTIDRFIVVGDRKTPAGVRDFCGKLESDFGINCVYLSDRDQLAYLVDFPGLRDFLPWDCIQRRNVGMLQAYQGNSDIVVTIDDDNFACQSDYLGFHAHVGDVANLSAISSASGWFNICELLEEARSVPFYHRGFPLSQRWTADSDYRATTTVHARTVVNAGLWLDDPDVDAITRLTLPIRVLRQNPKFPERVACDVGTWSPFNSQNTAVLREAIPAYFLFPHVGRYDDIWASYVVRRISDHVLDVVTYGAPLVRQKRNVHNYFKDFDAERFGLENNEVFLEALRECRVTRHDYAGAFGEIAGQFPEAIAKACEARRLPLGLFAKISEGFKVWATAIAASGVRAAAGAAVGR